jgi:hypothetical protein
VRRAGDRGVQAARDRADVWRTMRGSPGWLGEDRLAARQGVIF